MTSSSDAPTSTVVDVRDLLDSPGATREVLLDVPVPEGFEVPLTDFVDEIAVAGALDGLVDGVLLRGTITAAVDQKCALCLAPVPTSAVSATVAEMFSDPAQVEDPDDIDDGYGIVDGMIKIDTLIRDTLADAVPSAPRCRPDCAGLCATCGADKNTTSCDCTDEIVDDRWAALASLKLDD